MEHFFKDGLMCDSTGDACWQLSVRVFSRSTHIRMLTCIINLQVNTEHVRLNKQDGWGVGVHGDRWFLSI